LAYTALGTLYVQFILCSICCFNFIWCKYVYPIRKYWYFLKFNMVAAVILDS